MLVVGMHISSLLDPFEVQFGEFLTVMVFWSRKEFESRSEDICIAIDGMGVALIVRVCLAKEQNFCCFEQNR
jgi:hypothetical protein